MQFENTETKEKLMLHINPADRANVEMLGMIEGEHFLVYDHVPANFVFVDDTMVHFTVIADVVRGDRNALSFELPKERHYIPGEEQPEPMNREQRRKAEMGKR